MLVRDFKEKQGTQYSDGFLNSLPDYCFNSACNAPMEMTEVLTSLKCSNPRCPTKIARRIIAITSMLGVKDLGNARAKDFVSKFELDNPLLVFAYDPDEDGEMGYSMSLDVSKKISSQFKSKNSFTLWEFVRLANLPFIQTSALSIFGDYDDLDEAYEKIESGGVEYIRQCLNISKGAKSSRLVNATEEDEYSEDSVPEVSIRALKIYTSLITFKADLQQAIKYVNIIKVHQNGMTTLKAVCSDEVGTPFKTKSDFYATVNNLYKNVHVEFLNSVTKGIDYLVWAGADGSELARVTNKVQKVRKYNETYKQHKEQGVLKDGEHYIPILTAYQFIDMLKSKDSNQPNN